MGQNQYDTSNPVEGDTNPNIGGKDLRSRVATWLNVLIIFTVILAAGAFISSMIMSSIVYDKNQNILVCDYGKYVR